MSFLNSLPVSDKTAGPYYGKEGRSNGIECGLVTVKDGKAIGLPLTKVTAHVNITNVVSEVTLRQTYVNSSKEVMQVTIDCDYRVDNCQTYRPVKQSYG